MQSFVTDVTDVWYYPPPHARARVSGLWGSDGYIGYIGYRIAFQRGKAGGIMRSGVRMKRRTKGRKSDPYRVLMNVAHDLEMEGIDGHTITDALFVAAVHGALVIVGHKEVAASLREMAVMVEAKSLDASSTTH